MDWSSDVCSSDLGMPWPRDQADWLAVSSGFAFAVANVLVRHQPDVPVSSKVIAGWLGDVLVAAVWILVVTEPLPAVAAPRTEERRGGKGCVRTSRYRWSQYP